MSFFLPAPPPHQGKEPLAPHCPDSAVGGGGGLALLQSPLARVPGRRIPRLALALALALALVAANASHS